MSAVIFVKKSESNIALKTTVRSSNSDRIHNIYKYTDDGCDKYFSVTENIHYIGYIDKDQFYIINLKNDDFDETQFNFINESLINILLSRGDTRLGYEFDHAKMLLIENKIMYLRDFTSTCEPRVNLQEAKSIIHRLNNKLKCTNYKIRLNYVFEMKPNTEITYYKDQDYIVNPYSLLLCLFDNNNTKCVASLTIRYDINLHYLEFDSRTYSKYEGMQINKLLRSVIIIIAKSLYPGIDSVHSEAKHPASAYLMINYFKAEMYDESDNPIQINKTREAINSYFKKYVQILVTKVKINEDSVQNAYKVFQDIVNMPLKCYPGEIVSKSSSTRGKRKSRSNSKSKSNVKSKSKRPKNM